MDILWICALAASWALTGWMVLGLARLDAAR
jgi:hypothetical protein